MKHILVTGGAGFIGNNLIRSLLQTGGIRITCLDNFDDFYERAQKQYNIFPFVNHPDLTLIKGDIRDEKLIASLPADITCIIHLAAKAGVRPSIKNPVLYQEVNSGGTQVLLEFARQRNIGQFIFASSSSVYGINENLPWNEDERLMPISPYASSKLSAEMLGHVYSHLYGIRFIALRFFTVYGPSQRPDLAIHKFFKSIIGNTPVPVYGDGDTSRDYTFVSDIVQGITAAISYNSSLFEIINLGNHRTIKLQDLIREIGQVCDMPVLIERLGEQPGDVPATFADNSKAARLLSYNPGTELRAGLISFYNWLREFEAWKLNHQTLSASGLTLIGTE